MIIAERAARVEAEVLAARAQAAAVKAEADAANARADLSSTEALISHYKLEIEKLRRQLYGTRSERTARLLEQMELQLEELEATATEDELAAEQAATRAQSVQSFQRKRPSRKPFPDHLPRERVVIPAPASCPCCGSDRLSKLGEDITETLEAIPRRWKVIQTVREKFSCRACETISQPPAPSHPIARGRAGPALLAQLLFSKYGLHLPLNRQSAVYEREGIELDVSTLADWVGAASATLMPLVACIESHIFAAGRIHADDTPVKVLAKNKCRTGRFWTYVRDDRPFGGTDPPAALFFYSRDRSGIHPEQHLRAYAGAMQADAYAGFNRLYEQGRQPGPIVEVACWAHARRKFFELARIMKAPIAVEAIARIDALFAIEREINGTSPERRMTVRNKRSRPLIEELEIWLRQQRAKLSPKSETTRAIDYSLKRWPAFTCFLNDGRLCISNNAAEREIRSIAVGRHNWTFIGSDEGGKRAAAIYTLINTAKLNDVDPQAWLTYVLGAIADYPAI